MVVVMVGEHPVGHAVGDELDGASVDLFEHLLRELRAAVVEKPAVDAGDAAHPGGERGDVVGDHDDGDALVDLVQELHERDAGLGVDRGGGLVEEEDVGV